MGKVEFSSRCVVIWFGYVLWVWLSDLVSFIGFYLGFTLHPVCSGTLAGLLMVPMLIWAKRHASFGKLQTASWEDWAVAACFSAFYLIKTLFPDESFDVINYHLLLQNPVWKDMAGSDALPGFFQGFAFPLADRLFYLFRAALGFRLGTLWNLLTVLVMYWQTRGILERLLGTRFRGLQPLAALAAVAQYDVLMQMATYMVELSAIVFVLESIWLLLKEENDTAETLAFAALQGFLFTMKLTNVIFIAPLLILYIAKNRKHITVSLFMICFAAGAAPVLMYLIHNTVMTGNPVFPYYNTIFHSPYYEEANFKDIRWGGETLPEILLWPFYAIVRPEYRQSEMPNPCPAVYGIAWAAAAVYLLNCLFRRKRLGKEYAYIGILVISSALIWSAASGHSRYYIAGFIILMVWGIASMAWLCPDSGKWLVLCGLLLMLPQAVLGGKRCLAGAEWAQRPSFFQWKQAYAEAFQTLGRDRIFGTPEQKAHPDKLIIVDNDSRGATLLNSDVPAISWKSLSDMVSDDIYAGWADKLESEMEEGMAMDTVLCTGRGQIPDLSPIYGYRIAAKSAERLEQNLFPAKDFYLVQLANPEESVRGMTRQKMASAVGCRITDIGQGKNAGSAEVLVSVPGFEYFSETGQKPLGIGTVKIYCLCRDEEKLSPPDWENAQEKELLAEFSVDMSVQKTYKRTLNLSGRRGITYLACVLELEEDKGSLAPLAGVWVRTSLTGRQYINGQYCFIRDNEGSVGRGWTRENQERSYAGYFGILKTGFFETDGGWYLFSDDGLMQTGWQAFGENWYYFSEDGLMQTGWVKPDTGGTFYLDDDGAMVTGKHRIDGQWYEFDSDGYLMESVSE